MERKVVDYKLEYNEKGKDKCVTLKIKRIPQSVLLDYVEFAKIVAEVHDFSKTLSMLVDEIGTLIAQKKSDNKEKVKSLISEKERIEEHIRGIDSEKFFTDRFALIKKLLEKNGISDEKFLTREFWEEDVDVSDLNNFLETVIYKDFGGSKKKAVI
jgi:hypothetical protein